MDIFKGKKAIELSVNIIVMLVIGLTILGLVIAFVTNFLGTAEDSFVGSITEDDRTKLQQVERERGNFAFLEGTLQVEKESNQRSKLYLKVRNAGDDVFEFYPSDGVPTDNSVLTVSWSPGRGVEESHITSGDVPIIYGPAIVLESGETGSYPLEVVAEEYVTTGTYYAEFKIEYYSDGQLADTESQVVTIEVD